MIMMTKTEKEAVNKFVKSIIKGHLVPNNQLPEEAQLKADDGTPNPFGYTSVVSVKKILDEWSKCKEVLENKDENQSRAGE